MQKARSIEVISERPRSAFYVRRRLGNALADTLLTSLSPCVGQTPDGTDSSSAKKEYD